MKQFKTESKRILDLMINSIYTNKEIFLREIISNASDAIDKLHFRSLTDSTVATDFEINIKADKDARTLTISDNGIGMTAEELEKNLGTIAESGTLAFKKTAEETNELIGQFGVGFYSVFMVADKVEVFSRAYQSEGGNVWTSEGASGYTIAPCDMETVGTKVVLHLKPDTDDDKFSEYLEQYNISRIVKQYSDYIHYPIKMEMKKSRKKEDSEEYEDYFEVETLNSRVPLWKKPKQDVTKDELDEFYKTKFHDYENPIFSVYARIEGLVNYSTLLFAPPRAPYDYYSKEYKRGLTLYCNGVMIMEKCEDILPEYLGFIKGVVDSPDLSLNISREILQKDKQVKAIATSLEKKAIAELKKMQETDREQYDKLFKVFGVSLKFGVYNDFGMRKDNLKDLLMFYSQKEQKLITLKEYTDKMPEDQKEIYYACGASAEKIAKLPQVERVTEKGYDALFLTDNVDEFVMKILESYADKKFKSVQSDDFSLDTDEEKKELDEKKEQQKGFTDFIKESLGDKVSEVRLSNRSKQYPVCLSSTGEISIEMEKVFKSVPKTDMAPVKAQKVLEINVAHPLYEKLVGLFETDKDKLKVYASVLFDEAMMLEGLDIEDVPEFVNKLSEILYGQGQVYSVHCP